MHEPFFLRGTLLYSSSPDTIEILDDGWLLCRDGRAAGVFRSKPERFANLDVFDYTGKLIIPGMTDLHVHAPQFSFRGLGMDLELLDWLNTYTFPEESKYEDLSYAETAYESFVSRLARSTTTRACIFATLHLPATLLLMQKLEDAGLSTYVGKVNMNRNCPGYLREISTNQAIRDTERWVMQSRERFSHTKPILTPRFIPSCTDDLMYALSRLRAKYDLPVQSHLSENYSEIAWIRELCPRSKNYGDAYEQFGMFGGGYPCIMAHCVHSNEDEQALMKKNGVFIAHSPESNMNLASGVAPINKFLDNGLLARLNNVVGTKHFKRVTYTQAIELLQKSGRKFDYPVFWGCDLSTEHERYITEEVFGCPVFVTDYPKEIKSFYMKQNPDGKTVAAVDLLVPGIGEIIGGSQRENDAEKLTARMKELGMDIDAYQWYIDLRRFGGVEHSGFGLGFERLLMYITGVANIRDILPFPRTTGSCDL